jgi:hypothetical protein
VLDEIGDIIGLKLAADFSTVNTILGELMAGGEDLSRESDFLIFEIIFIFGFFLINIKH